MKISAGSLKGRTIDFKFKKKPRPTTSLIRKAIYNILGSDINDSTFLDVFAGSGAVGIEAYSRGAKQLVFCESDPLLYKSLKQTTETYNIPSHIFRFTYKRSLRLIKAMHLTFDYIFIDPPYFADHSENAAMLCLKLELLKKNGVIIIEKHKHDCYSTDNPFSKYGAHIGDTRKYGMTILEFITYDL
jgi:16S rRNA (guanine966-N2)-methyltransferase